SPVYVLAAPRGPELPRLVGTVRPAPFRPRELRIRLRLIYVREHTRLRTAEAGGAGSSRRATLPPRPGQAYDRRHRTASQPARRPGYPGRALRGSGQRLVTGRRVVPQAGSRPPPRDDHPA